MDTILWLLLLLYSLCVYTATGNPHTPPDRTDTLAAQQIRREGYAAIDKADAIREQAYRVMEEALEMKKSALEAKSALESVLVEAITLFRSQSSATNVYIQEMRTTLGDIEDKIGDLEDKIEGVEDKIEGVEERMDKQDEKIEENFAVLGEQTNGIKEKMAEQEALSSSISEHVSETLSTAQTLKSRQEVQINEDRLISLFKNTGTNNPHPQRDAGLAVDGMVTFGQTHWSDMAAHTDTPTADPGNKLWVELGGLFKIHVIKIWNVRHCCTERIVGTHVYVDETLVGTVIRAEKNYEFTVDGVYGREITLVQPLSQHLHIIELQVWGTGPYSEDDRFS